MAKRKKKESVTEFRDRVSKDEIMDTTADPMICETGSGNADIILETRLGNYRSANDMVFSMRMNGDLLKHIKQIAREKSAGLKADVPYQLLMIQAIEEKYPLPKEK